MLQSALFHECWLKGSPVVEQQPLPPPPSFRSTTPLLLFLMVLKHVLVLAQRSSHCTGQELPIQAVLHILSTFTIKHMKTRDIKQSLVSMATVTEAFVLLCTS